MVDRAVELSSRGIAVDRLINSCVDLLPNRGRRDLPVILLLGTRGSGKTTLLREIHQRSASVRPSVLLEDLSAHDRLRPHEVAARLAFGLSNPVKPFGQLGFPRFALGLAAIRSDVGRDDWKRAREVLRGVLLRDRRGLIRTIRAIGDGLLQDLGAPPPGKAVFGLALEGAAAVWTVMRLRRGPFTWYRQALGPQFQDPLAALIQLSLWEASGAQEVRDEVDQVLCRAFLADLRDAFTTGWRARLRLQNCVALIDNADSPTGQELLALLAKERARHAEHTREDCDPLVVVAAGRTRFPELALLDGRGLPAQNPRDATYEDWAGKRDSKPKSWLYPVELADLDDHDRGSEEHLELTSLARQWPRATEVAHVVRKLHELTHGHLWSCGLLLRAVAAAVERDDAGAVDLRRVLDWPDPDRPTQTLADRAIDRLLSGTLQEPRDDLITCAAAGDVGIPSRWRALGRPEGDLSPELDQFCSADLWALGAPATRRGPTLHPFLRRVLLHALARRGDRHPDSWWAVHGRLRDYYRLEERDVTQTMYHTLALGDLAPVVAHLDRTFAPAGMAAWLQELHAITTAPRRAVPAVLTPRDQVAELASGVVTDINDVLARLVAALWISKDPLGDPSRTLDLLIVADLNRLAYRAGGEAGVLNDEAQHYHTRGQRRCWVGCP